MVLQHVGLHCGRHVKSCRRGGGSVDGEVEMGGLGGRNKMGVGARGKLECGVESLLLLLLRV